MIVQDVITTARDLYNATSDGFFTDTIMWNWIWHAANRLATEAWLIEQVYTTTTVAGQKTYDFPTTTIAIKRVTYNGKKVKPYTFRQDDAATLSNSTAVTQGWVIYYTQFNYEIYCQPIPDSANPLVLYTFNQHSVITSSSQALDLPQLFHMPLVNAVLARMHAKDKDFQGAAYYDTMFAQDIMAAKRWKNKKKAADAFSTVENEEVLPVTIFGEA